MGLAWEAGRARGSQGWDRGWQGGPPGLGHRLLLGLLALCPGQSLIRLERWISQAVLSQGGAAIAVGCARPVIERGRSPIPSLPQGWKEHLALSCGEQRTNCSGLSFQ